MDGGTLSRTVRAIMAAPSGLTRFSTFRRSGPHPSCRSSDECGTRNAKFGTEEEIRVYRSALRIPHSALFLSLPSGEDAGDEVQDVSRA